MGNLDYPVMEPYRRRLRLPLGRLYNRGDRLVLHDGPRVGGYGPDAAPDPHRFGTVDQAFLLRDGGKHADALLRIQLLYPAGRTTNRVVGFMSRFCRQPF